jgi:hypothetical protein
MPRFARVLLALLFPVWSFTGCRTLVTEYDKLRAAMTPEPDEDINHYGAFFRSPVSFTPELPAVWSVPHFHDPNANTVQGTEKMSFP